MNFTVMGLQNTNRKEWRGHISIIGSSEASKIDQWG
jgi:hypothetical protein